jgi:tetratricopeptide (TPR) repeat protein
LARAALVGATVLLLAGCPRPLPPVLNAATVKASELPEDREELIKYADAEMKKDSVEGAENSLVALEKAIGAHAVTVIGRDYDALWRAARACAWVAEDVADKKTRDQFAYHGVEYAKAATALEPRRVEGHYYLGINTGLSATTKTLSAYPMVPRVRDEAKAAAKADPAFDHAGPLRLLGGVFSKAPPWPASIGDNEEGQKYLSQAVKMAPEYPENHLLYGDALAADDKLNEAAREYKQVLDAPDAPEYKHRLERWKRDAATAMQKLGRRDTASSP